MALAALIACFVFMGVCALGYRANARRLPEPVLDRETRKRVSRAVNRGELPPTGSDRTAAMDLAQWRAGQHWAALGTAGLAAAVVAARGMDPSADPPSYAVIIPAAAVILAVALLQAFFVAQGRRALAAR